MKKETNKEMWIYLFVLFVSAQSDHAVILDRDQLEAWYPNYLTETKFGLNARQITSISNDTFNGLSKLQELYLNYNQLNKLDSYIFNGLIHLEGLYLGSNMLTSLDASFSNDLSQLKILHSCSDDS